MRYIPTIVLLSFLVTACASLPVSLAEARLDIPDRWSNHGYTVVTEVSACYVDLDDHSLGTFKIQKISYDTKPEWEVYQYIGFYLYGETVPFVVTKFDEAGELIAVELFGEPVSFDKLAASFRIPCDAARVIYGKVVV